VILAEILRFAQNDLDRATFQRKFALPDYFIKLHYQNMESLEMQVFASSVSIPINGVRKSQSPIAIPPDGLLSNLI